MKIAIAQLNPTIGDIQANSEAILAIAQGVAAGGSHLLLTPELSLCGYPPRDLLLDPSFISTLAPAVAALATQLPPQLTVLVGFAEVNLDAAAGRKPLFNSVACLRGGCIQQVIRKRLLPTYDVFDEDRYFASGSEPGVITVAGLRLGITICEDLWNDEQFWGQRAYTVDPMAELMAAPVDLLVNVSASPYVCGKHAVREAMLSHGARRYQRSVIYVNQVGGNDDLIFDGRSMVCAAGGKVIARAAAFEDAVLEVVYDPQTQGFTGGSLAPDLGHSREAEIWAALVLGVRDYAQKCGFQRAVLGLSGGIDSALVAAIATAALGPENVLGVLMPSPYSSEHSITDAQDLATNLGHGTTLLPIGKLMAAYEQSLTEMFRGTDPDVAEENIQARIRGTLLMAIANKFGRLLISTGNKSELAVGYCTLYGDMSGGLAAISDVPKTVVYSLCHWLNTPEGRHSWSTAAQAAEAPATVIPEHILLKPPSAELKPGQVDQDSLPAYDILDDILVRLIDQHQSRDAIIAAGYPAATVERVIHLVKRAEFKRRQAPPGLKITDRAFGTGWRMPIAARVTGP